MARNMVLIVSSLLLLVVSIGSLPALWEGALVDPAGAAAGPASSGGKHFLSLPLKPIQLLFRSLPTLGGKIRVYMPSTSWGVECGS